MRDVAELLHMTQGVGDFFLHFILPLLAAGLLAGVMSGLFGIGGGAILVPVLYQLFGVAGVEEAVRMQLAVGTSLGIIVPTSLRSFQSHLAHGAVDLDYLRKVALWVVLGVGAGSLAALVISGAGLRFIYAVLALLMGLKMLLDRQMKPLWTTPALMPVLPVAGGLIGFFSVLMGIGGGVFNNILMTLLGRDIHKAVATSSGVGVLIALPGVLGFMGAGYGLSGLPIGSIGYVNFLAVLLVIPASILTAPIGAGLAHRLPQKTLQKGFALFLLLVSARFFFSLW